MADKEHDSNSVEKEINSLLKDINQKNKLSVIGFIRHYALNEHNIDIPAYIINYFIVYVYLNLEYWDKHGPTFVIKD